VLDEIQQELEWANRNSPDREQVAAAYRRITSVPRDPCAPEWAERVNQYSAADVPVDVADPPTKQQGQLTRDSPNKSLDCSVGPPGFEVGMSLINTPTQCVSPA
jgi:hypothetical protein